MREEAGDQAGAEILYRQAADQGNTNALYRSARMREEAGDQDGTETLARQAADHGSADDLYRVGMPNIFNRLGPYGLDPDGTPTSPWQPSTSVERSGHVPPGTS